MKMIRLKNGAEEAEQLVAVTMASIRQLWGEGMGGMLAVSDLVQICRRDPTYRKFGTNEDKLTQYALLGQDGQPHNSVRNIVLSAFTGEGLELELGSPVAQ